VIVTGLAALVGSFALGAVALRSARGSRASEQTADARAKANEVGAAIDKAYKDLPLGTTSEWHDVSSLISPLIPPGTPYDLTEEILWHAGFGFRWSRLTAAKPMDENFKRCPTIAVRRRLRLSPLGEFQASVTLVPDRRMKFDAVERTCAVIRGVRWT
jgi:hypothetical protein